MTKYSVPGLGGHIDFSDDVTIYPVLVMARTVNITTASKLSKTAENVDWESCQTKFSDILDLFVVQYHSPFCI